MRTDDKEEMLLKEFFRRRSTELPGATPSCPDENQLAALVDQTLDQDARKDVVLHLESCQPCREQVGFLLKAEDLKISAPVPTKLLEQARKPKARPRRRPLFTFGIPGFATALVLVLALFLWNRFELAPPVPPSHAERGVDSRGFSVLSPAQGTVVRELPFELRWESVEGAFSYEVRIATLGGTLVWQERTPSTESQLPPESEVKPGVEYYFYVRAHLPGDRVIRSEMVRFRIGALEN